MSMKNDSHFVKSKLPKIKTSIFSIMSQMADEHGAINLSQGFPDFSCNNDLISLVSKYMKKGYNQYAPMQGIMPLREVISEKVATSYSAKYDPVNEITITAGATQAINAVITAMIGEGDEVIIFEPAYDCYSPDVMINGGTPIYVELQYPEYSVNWEQVKKVINQRTKMIIINTPHNPTGSILTAADMLKLQKLTDNTDIVILSDEVYEHIIFDQLEHQSIARYPILAERSFITFSFGKTFHNTGWKMGYCLAPQNLMEEFRKVHQFIVYSANTPIQYALTDYLSAPENYNTLPEFYQEKRDYFLNLLKGTKFKFLPAQGTYFQLLSYDNIIKTEKDTELAVRMTKELGVASIPISAFYHNELDNHVLRFCFAKSKSTLEKAAKNLCRI